jgi:hypothetical protein
VRRAAFEIEVGYHAINAVAILFELIKREIVLNQQIDNQAGRDTNRKPGNIYQCKYFVPPKIADGYFYVVSYH